MTQSNRKAIVINQFWAGIIATLISTAILGGFGAYAQQAVTQEKVERLEQANLPTRLDKLEEKVDGVKDQVQEVRDAQREQSKMLGELIRNVRAPEGHPAR